MRILINYKLIVGSNLNQLRKQQNKSQAEVAKYLELTVAAYQNYEAGRREANYETLVKLADFYGVTTDFILGREPAPTPFADLDLSEDDEAEVAAKYMSLPPEIRACLLDVLIQLGDAAKKRRTEPVQSNAQPEENQIKKTDVYDSELAIARSRNGGYMPAPTDEQYNSFEKLTDDMLGE